ncbi:RNA-directed DNA polymerase from mobile element jockey [Plakobranchus ocellatus]|uniref:RNA-directed DNA polymerase from mobile element jockey n=1 Tax=Plakobranchus ocellatus TaxID=259542 RepID=A0AAV4E0E7_9GAST|nr:RNA-directed DNA polymerase from mobile element jockey [Plakobranchus ocellatus]
MIQFQGSPPATEPNQGDTLRGTPALCQGYPGAILPAEGVGPLLMSELKNSIVKSNESAAGPDGVYYQFLRHLLKLFNNIWTTGDIPPSWREALVVPIPKPGKDPSDPKPGRILLILPTIGLLRSRAACVNASLFVDDFAIYAEGKHLQHLERTIQLCINNVQKWVSENSFRFSVSKTTCVHFHRQRIYTEPALHLDGQPIPVKSEAKFLGIVFDSKLNFSSRVKYLKKKCLKALNLLRVVGHKDWGADRATPLKLYRILVRSKLDYGSVIYGSAKKHVLRALDPIHHQGLRIALGAFRTSPIKSLYAEAMTLYLKLTFLLLQSQNPILSLILLSILRMPTSA